MAMLAERKSKRKWCLNPNGKDWSEDNNKFGQKMLEKMGWKKGCGLGINLQGQKEHVKVSVKNDSKGLGCDANHDLEWLNHQENYSILLSELSSSIGDGILTAVESSSGKSLEDKSKTSRARVHYKKFVRGKDVSRYSGVDLKCILGKTEGVTQKRPSDEIENEGPETNPKINVKKKKKDKFENHCDEGILEEYADDTKSRSEGIEYSDTGLMYVVREAESVIDEMRLGDSVENGVSETSDQSSGRKKKKKKNSSEEMEERRDEDLVSGNDFGKAEVFTQKRPIDNIENGVSETNDQSSSQKKKKKKKNSSEEIEERCDEEFVRGCDFSKAHMRPLDDIENKVPETNSTFNLKKKKKHKSDDCFVKEIAESHSDDSKSKSKGFIYSETDLMYAVGQTESVDGIENRLSETNNQACIKKKKKKEKISSEESEGHDEGFIEGSPKNRNSKTKKSVETIELPGKNNLMLKEELQCKFEEDEISFSGSNLHVVKGYRYHHK